MQHRTCNICSSMQIVGHPCTNCAELSTTLILGTERDAPRRTFIGIGNDTADIMKGPYLIVVFNSGDLDLWAVAGIGFVEGIWDYYQFSGETWVKRSDFRVFKKHV